MDASALMMHPINLGSRLELQGLAGCQLWDCGLAPLNNCKASHHKASLIDINNRSSSSANLSGHTSSSTELQADHRHEIKMDAFKGFQKSLT